MSSCSCRSTRAWKLLDHRAPATLVEDLGYLHESKSAMRSHARTHQRIGNTQELCLPVPNKRVLPGPPPPATQSVQWMGAWNHPYGLSRMVAHACFSHRLVYKASVSIGVDSPGTFHRDIKRLRAPAMMDTCKQHCRPLRLR